MQFLHEKSGWTRNNRFSQKETFIMYEGDNVMYIKRYCLIPKVNSAWHHKIMDHMSHLALSQLQIATFLKLKLI